jgi:hypothetical protein
VSVSNRLLEAYEGKDKFSPHLEQPTRHVLGDDESPSTSRIHAQAKVFRPWAPLAALFNPRDELLSEHEERSDGVGSDDEEEGEASSTPPHVHAFRLFLEKENGELVIDVAAKRVPVFAREPDVASCRPGMKPATTASLTARALLVKEEVSAASTQTQIDLTSRFPSKLLCKALSIVHIKFWEGHSKETATRLVLEKYLPAIKNQYCEEVVLDDGTKLPPMLDWEALQEQSSEFLRLLPARAKQATSTSELWRGLASYHSIACLILKFIKLARLYLSIPIGSVDNERRFSRMNLVKTPVRNRLSTVHLDTCMLVSCSHFTPHTYPYKAAHEIWSEAKACRM